MAGFGVLFVCLGNVCRSPLAERLLLARVGERLGDPAAAAVTVSSAGVRALVGAAMEENAAAELVRLGGDPSGFTARQLTPRLVDEAGLVLTATRTLRSRALEEAPRALRRTFTIREFAALADQASLEEAASPPDLVAAAAGRRALAALDDYDIPDPIGRPPQVHREVADLLDAACTAIARALTTGLGDDGTGS